MSFPAVPNESKSTIDKAGSRIAQAFENENDLKIVNDWRACHAYPINTFRALLNQRVARKFKNAIIAQRLKRLPTIIDKLRRYPGMRLTQMQDIGGLRVVLSNQSEVKSLVKIYEKSRFRHELISKKDYISFPRGEDGYRSVHLIYRYNAPGENAQQYKGLTVELQIRTKRQHSWATAVETMGIVLKQALKSRKGDKEWLEFFALVSSAFAHIEKTSLVPGYEHLSRAETFTRIYEYEKKLGVIEKLRSYAFLADHLTTNISKKKWQYHLITLNPDKRTLSIESFGRDELEKATEAYSKAEKKLDEGEKVDTVLVSVGPFEQLKRAYPNYFLDVKEFIKYITQIIEEARPRE